MALSTPKWERKDSVSCIPESTPTGFPRASVSSIVLLTPLVGHKRRLLLASVSMSRPAQEPNLLCPPFRTAWLSQPIPPQPPAPGAGSEAVPGHPHHQVRPADACAACHLTSISEKSAPQFAWAESHCFSQPWPCHKTISTSESSACDSAGRLCWPGPGLTDLARLSHMFGSRLAEDQLVQRGLGRHDWTPLHMSHLPAG